MKLTKIIFFLLCTPLFSGGQSVSVLPTHLPEYAYGAWVNDKNEIELIISQDYIVIQNQLYSYNEIVKEHDKINFTCILNYNVKYVNISKIGSYNILLDEGYKITQLVKSAKGNLEKIPKSLLDNWYAGKNKIELKSTEVLYADKSYIVDYVASSNEINNIVIYNSGEYSLLHCYTNDKGQFLNANFVKPILFKKASFFQKHKLILLSLLLILVLALSYCLIKLKIRQAKKKEVAKRLFTEMQLKGIRSQMNPHFLFNALSAIQNLINKGDNEKANHYLTEFSQLMRLTLDKSEKGLVPLYEEVESIKKYLELEKLRFHFEYDIKIDAELDLQQTEIPAMLIQPFVENAIVHGLYGITGEKKISIVLKIETNNLLCFILDNGIGFNKAQEKKTTYLKREKYGVKLAKDRIDLINQSYNTNAKVTITDISNTDLGETGTKVEVYIPLKY